MGEVLVTPGVVHQFELYIGILLLEEREASRIQLSVESTPAFAT